MSTPDPEQRKLMEGRYIQVQGLIRMAAASGEATTIDATGISLEHVSLLKEAWGNHLEHDGGTLKLDFS